MTWKVHCAEFIAWAQKEAERIRRGVSKPYHAVLCDPPYGLEFMGNTWDSFSNNSNSALGGQSPANKKAGTPFKRRGKPIGGWCKKDKQAGSHYQVWTTEWAKALLPLLHPGALVFAFGGTRTWHRLACGFEEAGFEAWDTLMWLHGQGFPKAQDLGGLIDTGKCRERGEHPKKLKGHTCKQTAEGNEWRGQKTSAFKPAWEPILCFRAPRQGKNYAELAMAYGSGALNVDGGRIATIECLGGGAFTESGNRVDLPGANRSSAAAGMMASGKTVGRDFEQPTGRYPANLVLECTCEELVEVDAPVCGDVSGEEPTSVHRPKTTCYGHYAGRDTFVAYRGKAIRHTDPTCPAYMLDEQAGDKNTTWISPKHKSNRHVGSVFPLGHPGQQGFSDKGGPSRFFYCAKASRSEREAGLESSETGVSVKMATNQHSRVCQDCRRRFAHAIDPCPRCGSHNWKYKPMLESGHKGKGIANNHPTVKPIALTRWLATLLLPSDSVKPRRLVIPFAGVASEGIGAREAGWDQIVMIEKSRAYARIGRGRMRHRDRSRKGRCAPSRLPCRAPGKTRGSICRSSSRRNRRPGARRASTVAHRSGHTCVRPVAGRRCGARTGDAGRRRRRS